MQRATNNSDKNKGGKHHIKFLVMGTHYERLVVRTLTQTRN
jgi:hypothetical protein